MDTSTLDLDKRIQQIKEFATNNSISYTTMLDILEDKNPPLAEDKIAQIITELAADGISIISSDATEDLDGETDEPDKFVPANVRVEQRPLTVWNLMERLQYPDELDLQPGFQRQGNLWSLEKQSRLIESLMLKIPLPAFYFDASQGEQWKVIDGLQRLTAMRRFLVGIPDPNEPDGEAIQTPFCGLQYLTDFNGITFQDLPRQYIRRIQESTIIAYTVEKGTPEAVVFNIFQRINTGGVPLEPQEIRHAMYQGKATKLTEELAKSKEFIKATGKAVSPERMLDLEYVTRFIAFTELDYQKYYKGDINSFLNRALKAVNAYPDEGLDKIRKSFKRIMGKCADLFGKYAFRRYNATGRRGPINKTIFELWAICFKTLPNTDIDILIANQEKFLIAFRNLQQTDAFILAMKANDSYALNRRVGLTKKMLEEFLCCNR